MTIVLKNIPDEFDLKFEKPSQVYTEKLNKILESCWKKNNGYVSLTIDKPRRPRTTGEKSQNNLIWKLITIIAQETGDDSEGMKDTENGIKLRAIGRGYPFHVNKLTGQKEPESMTKIDTVQCSYLIETAYEIIAELGIVLPPNIENEYRAEKQSYTSELVSEVQKDIF